jgi:hypothetical protein
MKLTQRQRDIENFKSSQHEILNKLHQLGVTATEHDMYDDETKTPEQYSDETRESQCDSDLLAYELFERLKETCQGVHQVDLLLGRSRLAVSCAGMDLLDLLPKPESIIRVREECEKREREGKHREELATSIFETR